MKKTLFFTVAFLCSIVLTNAQNKALQITADSTWALVDAIPEVVSDITIEAWIKLDAAKEVAGYTGIVDCRGGTNTQALILKNNTETELSLGYEWGGAWGFQPDTFEVKKGIWQHVALVISSVDKNAKFYVNGLLKAVNSEYSQLGEQVTLGGDMRIANGNSMKERTIIGLIDEVRLWKVARTEAQIQADMNHEINATTTGLFAYYQCNETVTAVKLTDVTGKGYDANLTGEDYTFVDADWGLASSLDKNSIHTVSLFPNPAQEILHLSSDFNNHAYSIFDLTGRIADQAVILDSSIKVDHLQAGIYFIEITKGTEKYFGKFLKN